jgi:hypothetical protein
MKAPKYTFLLALFILLSSCGEEATSEPIEPACSSSIQLMPTAGNISTVDFSEEDKTPEAVEDANVDAQQLISDYFNPSIKLVLDSLSLELTPDDVMHSVGTIENTDILEIHLETTKTCDCVELLNLSVATMMDLIMNTQAKEHEEKVNSINNELDFIAQQIKILESELSKPSPYAAPTETHEAYQEAYANLDVLNKQYTLLIENKTILMMDYAGVIPSFMIIEPAR